MLKFGLIMWKFRNKLVHGNEDGISVMEDTKMRALVDAIYSDIAPWTPADTKWMSNTARTERLVEPIGYWCVGLGLVREYRFLVLFLFIFPLNFLIMQLFSTAGSSVCSNCRALAPDGFLNSATDY